MTSDGDSRDPAPARERGLAGDAERVLDAAGQRPRRASPLRWLVVILPLVLIVGIGTWLLTTWSGRVSRFAEEMSARPRASAPLPRPMAPPPRPGVPQPAVAPVPQRPAELDVQAVVAAIAKADPEAGAATFKICQVCHNADQSGAARIGPNLWGVVGRRKAARQGFPYSASLRARGGVWTYDDLATFLHNPRKAVPGTKMAFAGIASPARLAGLLAHLRTLGDTPAPLPGQP